MAKEIESGFLKALDDFRREIGDDLRSPRDSTKFCRDGFDEVGRYVKALRKEVWKLTQTNQELQAENIQLNQRVNELAQYVQANNLKINGVVATGDTFGLARKIGHVVEESITDADIDICDSVSSQTPDTKNIVVGFVQ